MSLLLKALDKSEDERKDAVPAEQTTDEGKPEKAEEQKFKLGSSTGKRLSSALKIDKDKEQADAASVVHGYEAGQADAEDTAEVAQARSAQTRGRLRTVAFLVLLIALGGGAYFAVDFLGLLREEIDTIASRTGTDRVEAAPEITPEDIVFLPLAEPEYDVQRDILQAVLAGTDGDIQTSFDQTDEDLLEKIRSFTENLLAENIREARAKKEEEEFAIAEALEEEKEALKTLEQRLDEVLEAETLEADVDVTNDYMLAQLDALDDEILVEESPLRRQFLAPAGTLSPNVFIAQAETAPADDESSAEDAPAPAPAPQAADEPEEAEENTITKARNELEKVFKRAVSDYEAGEFDAAENGFRTVLASTPLDVNSMVGLAKVHSSRGNVRLALNTLLRASELAPNNPLVITELIALQGDSAQSLLSEQRLLGLLGHANERLLEARIQFLLGGLYARQERWFEAREMFAHAHATDSANPDYAYNLAVVFDFLNEQEQAAKKYRYAAEMAANAVSAFDPAVALDRANELEKR